MKYTDKSCESNLPNRLCILFSVLDIKLSFLMLLNSLLSIDCSTRPRSAVGNVSGNRCEFDCRSRGSEFDPGPVPYFSGD